MDMGKEFGYQASVEISLDWQSSYGHHQETIFAEKIDFWRDFFPGDLLKKVSALSPGEKTSEAFGSGVLVPAYSRQKKISFARKLFSSGSAGSPHPPVPGRYYPKGAAWRPLRSFPDDMSPFRVLTAEGETIVADTNHPLADYPLLLSVTMIEKRPQKVQRGGSASDIAELVSADGPGMQLPCSHDDSHRISDKYPFLRANEEPDSFFYQTPRLVHHLDSTARSIIRKIYAQLLSPSMRVLDLMSSWESHMPEILTECRVTGLGLNREELEQNGRLNEFTIQDINSNHRLPLPDNSFGAVICTASIEYLVNPLAVMAEVERVLQPGGIFVVVASERWFPGKEILPWADLHPFERQGLVLKYFLHDKLFKEIHTLSFRGFPRPSGDKYSPQLPSADPLYVVWGKVQ